MDRRIAAAAAAGLALIVGTIPAVRAEHILPTHPTLQLDPANVEDAAFGSAIALPDLNGDGAQDLVVGASSWGGNAAGEGRIASFLHTDGAWDRVGARISHPTDQAGSSFGFALASAGDVDGDGFEDVVVGAPDWNAPLANDIGRAYLYRGREGGLRVTDWSPVGGAEAADRFGWSVAGAGDVNGDGFDDVAVGCLNCDGSVEGEGTVSLYLGSADGLATVPAATLEPADHFHDAFGASVAFADVNGDTFSDLVVGAYDWRNAEGVNECRAFAYLGSAEDLATTPSWTADPTNQAFSDFGYRVSSAGDLDRDGFEDFAVAAPLLDDDVHQRGRVWIYRGSSTGLRRGAAWTLRGPHIGGSWFGVGLASGGDVDGDGFDDLLVGAQLWGRAFGGEGRVFVYLASAAGPARLWDFPGHPVDQEVAYFGHAVAAFDRGGIVAGAFQADDDATDEGAVHLFERPHA